MSKVVNPGLDEPRMPEAPQQPLEAPVSPAVVPDKPVTKTSPKPAQSPAAPE